MRKLSVDEFEKRLLAEDPDFLHELQSDSMSDDQILHLIYAISMDEEHADLRRALTPIFSRIFREICTRRA